MHLQPPANDLEHGRGPRCAAPEYLRQHGFDRLGGPGKKGACQQKTSKGSCPRGSGCPFAHADARAPTQRQPVDKNESFSPKRLSPKDCLASNNGSHQGSGMAVYYS